MTGSRSPNVFGPLSFRATLATTLVFEVAAVATGYSVIYLLYFVLPALLTVAAVGGYLALCEGKATQIGRGMLIGCMAAPLTAAIAVAVIVLT
ncbi:hypothetical protein M2272_004644 [Mycobacterium frederiksbergense]|uniref:DUF4190 domain-containing protein n=1 Tax=Mycolicibacterium frederiksbergense TaxID=117567 RepID=A0ABT6L512_9MYCO|nr:hypothetical protein [Mycolicibacterium frederiksbergense]MDH6197988.1 hypothetical protein [Mycolicibacterium frederiksbergense]